MTGAPPDADPVAHAAVGGRGEQGGGPAGGIGRIAGAAVLITMLTVAARVAGFGRTFVFLRTVGQDDLADVYSAANTVPNVVFELAAGGALAGLVVPLLAGAVAAGDRRRVDAVTSALLTWVLTLLVLAAVLLAVAAGPIAALLFDVPQEQEVAARMLRVFAPQLPLYGLGIVLTGVLQAHHRFAWPVIAPLLSSVTVMGAYLGYAAVDGPRSELAGLTPAGELTLSVGTTAGVVVLATCLFVPLRRLRLRLRPGYRFPGDVGRQAVRLGWAGAVTVGAQQVMVVVVVVILADDGYARFSAAQTVFLLPWAVLAVPLATAAYPGLTAAATAGDESAYADTLARSARSVALLTCLGAAALGGLAGPAAAVLRLAPDAAAGMVGFAPGLLGYGLFALLSRALYARGATVAAAAATAAGWGLGAAAAPVLRALLGDEREIFALALAHTVGTTAIGALLVFAVRRTAGPAALTGLGRAAGAGTVAATVAGPAGWAVVRAFGDTPGSGSAVLQGMLGGVVVTTVFVAVAYVLDRRDVRPLTGRLARRRGARAPDVAPVASADRGPGAPRPPDAAAADGKEQL